MWPFKKKTRYGSSYGVEFVEACGDHPEGCYLKLGTKGIDVVIDFMDGEPTGIEIVNGFSALEEMAEELG